MVLQQTEVTLEWFNQVYKEIQCTEAVIDIVSVFTILVWQNKKQLKSRSIKQKRRNHVHAVSQQVHTALSSALKLANFCAKISQLSAWPQWAAACRGVQQSLSRTSISAPAFNNTLIAEHKYTHTMYMQRSDYKIN